MHVYFADVLCAFCRWNAFACRRTLAHLAWRVLGMLSSRMSTTFLRLCSWTQRSVRGEGEDSNVVQVYDFACACACVCIHWTLLLILVMSLLSLYCYVTCYPVLHWHCVTSCHCITTLCHNHPLELCTSHVTVDPCHYVSLLTPVTACHCWPLSLHVTVDLCHCMSIVFIIVRKLYVPCLPIHASRLWITDQFGLIWPIHLIRMTRGEGHGVAAILKNVVTGDELKRMMVCRGRDASVWFGVWYECTYVCM